jgi:hypothetical protein
MVREMFGGRVNFPHTPGLVFDYFLDPAAGWIFAPWDNLVPAFHYSPSAPFHTILVPTVVRALRCPHQSRAPPQVQLSYCPTPLVNHSRISARQHLS